jgi:hypothetical protein
MKRYSREKDLPRKIRKGVILVCIFMFVIIITILNVCFALPFSGDDLKPHSIITTPIQRYFNDTYVIYQVPPSIPYNGVVFISHACTHGAYDFWPNSSTCVDCVGLSEEVAIVKRVLASGFVAVAASSADRQYKCWSGAGGKDIDAVAYVIHSIRTMMDLQSSPVFALGCSSGGPFVWHLAKRGIVDGIIVQSFDIDEGLLERTTPNTFPVIFNPMPKDKGTYNRVIKNIQLLENMGYNSQFIRLKPCAEFPVDVGYLQDRLGFFLSLQDIKAIMQVLESSGYVQSSTGKLLRDPTVDGGETDWRVALTQQLSPEVLSKLVLTKGRSPMAKSLNRAWAFHEYCADYVVESLEWLMEMHGVISIQNIHSR